ncbi:ATP-binding protein [Mycobacterium sp. 236(2023)]|uniref:ATP-binding protein n=1 Tax=Mycobacterium sp. 236(2023) TaxID=3038163 RepID=UPI002414EDFC|nr:ATP-binding protein [Mycobacterium sp. 236(2023)]MDG4665609.1 ATP-binding protein [Mycobacterium sp. 236(2023)]
MSESGAIEELRTLFLFDSLTEAQLDTLWRHGEFHRFAPGPLFAEGDPAQWLYVLLDGEITLSKRSSGTDIEVLTTAQKGAFFGAVAAVVPGAQLYDISVCVVAPSRMFLIDACVLGQFMRQEFAMACHFLIGTMQGQSTLAQVVGPRDRLAQLHVLTAGLTHELNNPAAAARRAASHLSTRAAEARRTLLRSAETALSPTAIAILDELQENAAQHVSLMSQRSSLHEAEAEELLGRWLHQRGIAEADDFAVDFAEGGFDVVWLESVATRVDSVGLSLATALRWLHHTVATALLTSQITDSAARISALLAHASHYTQLDRSPFDAADVRVLLSSTVAMLAHRLTGVTVIQDFDDDVPPISCWPAELNQAWTSLIDNAVDAIGAVPGTVTLRVRRQGRGVRVEVCDTGPGVPVEIQQQIFDPFFTTKPTGAGRGLGLDLAGRVARKHQGHLWVESQPGDTRFIIVLPGD